MSKPVVTTYQMIASNGRPIRKATKVTFADGREVRFIELMSKREAIKQAARESERAANVTIVETIQGVERFIIHADGSRIIQSWSDVSRQWVLSPRSR